MKTWSTLTKIDKPEPVEIFVPLDTDERLRMPGNAGYIVTNEHGMLRITAHTYCSRTKKHGILGVKD